MQEWDCKNYDRCPKEFIIEDRINKDDFNLLFVGCWGVYCRDDIDEDGSEYRQKIVSQAMADYSKQHQIDVVILAGDNIYESNDKSLKHLPKPLRYDINKQLDDGFIHCMRDIKTDRFLIGVGNHDLETCEIITKQIQYTQRNWTLPALSYRVLYQMRKFYINMIFIDTNIYKKKWCRTDPNQKAPAYPKEAQVSQAKWLKNQLEIGKTKNAWNIVIGHDPFYTRSHKNRTIIRSEQEFLQLIKENAEYINLYMCADEHNQQYVSNLIVNGKDIFYNDHRFTDSNGIKLPPQIIAGSGGTKLDRSISDEEELTRATQFYQAAFGFVSMSIGKDHIKFQFNGVSSPETHAADSEVFEITKE
jgi:hypothetical protein